MTDNERKLAKALTLLIAEVEAKARRKPAMMPGEEDNSYFGSFSVGKELVDGDVVVSWPELRSAVETAKELTNVFDVIGGEGT